MKELSEYVRQYYIREPPLPFTVTEAFGSNLDCTKDPLDGEGYRYDPQTGHVVLPPFCAPAVLRRNERFAKEGRTPPYFQ